MQTWIILHTALTIVLIVLVVFLSSAAATNRSRRRDEASTSADAAESAPPVSHTQKDIDRLIASLHELTSNVDLQVGQHSLRINEITDTLNEPNSVGSAMILVAGKMLITANQKLQTDLEDARSEIKRQREVLSSCLQESRIDALTNIANRRAFDTELVRFYADRRRNKTTFSLLIMDIDHFKRVNDQYGHMVGDQLLKSFSRCLAETFRESDFVARFGGEEFVALLPKAPLEEACKAAERIRNVVAGTHHRIGDLDLQITVSIGVKEIQDNERDEELLQRTDKALYAAKNGGRNCIYTYEGTQCHRYIPCEVLPEQNLLEGEVAAIIPAIECELDDLSKPKVPSFDSAAELIVEECLS